MKWPICGNTTSASRGEAAIKHGLGREDEVDRPATASTGKEDGAETGDAMGHMIVPDGPFDRAVGRLLARGLVVSWIEQLEKHPSPDDDAGEDEDSKSKSGKRIRYVCPHGDMKAWESTAPSWSAASIWRRWTSTSRRRADSAMSRLQSMKPIY